MNTMKNEPLSGRSMPENNKTEYKAHYHLPGLFEFYELYKVFLPLYREHREYFTTGVISARCMEHRETASGVVAEWDMATAMPEMCWSL